MRRAAGNKSLPYCASICLKKQRVPSTPIWHGNNYQDAPMIADTLPDVFLTAAPGTDFFLARQPILNREQRLVAYELLFRSAASGPADVTDDLSATATAIAHAAELGMARVIGASLGYVDAA